MEEIAVFNLDGTENGGKKVIQNQEYTFTMEFVDFQVDLDGNEIPDTETPLPFDPLDKVLISIHHAGKEVFKVERGNGIEVIGDGLNILRITFTQEQTVLLGSKFEYDLMIINSQDKNRYNVKGIGSTTKTLGRK